MHPEIQATQPDDRRDREPQPDAGRTQPHRPAPPRGNVGERAIEISAIIACPLGNENPPAVEIGSANSGRPRWTIALRTALRTSPPATATATSAASERRRHPTSPATAISAPATITCVLPSSVTSPKRNGQPRRRVTVKPHRHVAVIADNGITRQHIRSQLGKPKHARSQHPKREHQ